MNIDLDRLEAAAKAATPGPWNPSPGRALVVSQKDISEPVICNCLSEQFAQAPKDAAFISAVNPAVVLELIAELRAKNRLLEEIFDDCGDKNGGMCPVCHMYAHKHWCWYPHLAKMLGKPLDGHDERFFALDNALRTAAKNKTD